MAIPMASLFLPFFLIFAFSDAKSSASMSFPLTAVPTARRHNFSSTLDASLLAQKTHFKYSMALTVSLPIGTPPQSQDMVIDTGSQLSWIKCHPKSPKPPPSSRIFNPSLSSTFSDVPCNHPVCKPQVPDFTIPTTCDQRRLCHYSYFYADGTLAEGNLIREKLAFAGTQSSPPVVLGCATSTTDDQGILGMNLGRLSFPSQAKLSKFSYCVPVRTVSGNGPGPFPTGSFVLGENPNSAGFQYVNLLTFPQGQSSPNLDPLAYTVPMLGIRVGAKRLAIPPSAFKPDAGGSGQTMIDSGSEFTYLVDEAYDKLREEVVRLVGPKIKKGYTYGNGVADMCFDRKDAVVVGRMIGGMAFEFENKAEIAIPNDRLLAEVDDKISCLAIGKSSMLGGAASNIIGNFHQQNMWVEFDLAKHQVGFGKADCSRT